MIMTIKILFIGLDYEDLDLPGEVQRITDALRSFGTHDQFDVRTEWRPTMKSLPGLIMRHNPHVLHLSGHGQDGRLLIANEDDEYVRLTPSLLARLLELENKVKCVVLNTCECFEQAQALSRSVDYVVGVEREISDQHSINFSVGFYQALATGRDVRLAFGHGQHRVWIDSEKSSKLFGLWVRDGAGAWERVTNQAIVRALTEFFMEAFSFSPGVLRERIGYLPNGLELKHLLPVGNAPIGEIAPAAANLVVERRALHREWLEDLGRYMPGHRRRIEKLAAMWADFERE